MPVHPENLLHHHQGAGRIRRAGDVGVEAVTVGGGQLDHHGVPLPARPGYPGAMGEIVNLNRAGKTRARAAKAVQAAANRVKHGRPAAERANDQRAERRRTALLEGTRRIADDVPTPSQRR